MSSQQCVLQIPSSVPQDTKLGPWLFICVVSDLIVHGASLWKYVDNTTVSEVEKGQISFAQQLVNSVDDWFIRNRFQLNEKCKKLGLTFAKYRDNLPPLLVSG